MSDLQKSKVYTRTGDSGNTGLVGGQRVSKSSSRIDLYGEVDELNSYVGVVRSLLKDNSVDEFSYLNKLQILLFDIGSNMASLEEDRVKYKLPQLRPEHISELENLIDVVDSQLAPLKYFVLPGGTAVASQLHVCRTVTRRIERKAISFNDKSDEKLDEVILKFFNRLSDYFFVLSRFDNFINKVAEDYWVPEK